MARQYRIDLRIGSHGFGDLHLARTGTTLIEFRHAIPPVLRGFGAIAAVEFNSHELLGFRKSYCRDIRADGWRRTEGRRRSGGRRRLRLGFEFRRDTTPTSAADDVTRKLRRDFDMMFSKPRIVAHASRQPARKLPRRLIPNELSPRF